MTTAPKPRGLALWPLQNTTYLLLLAKQSCFLPLPEDVCPQGSAPSPSGASVQSHSWPGEGTCTPRAASSSGYLPRGVNDCLRQPSLPREYSRTAGMLRESRSPTAAGGSWPRGVTGSWWQQHVEHLHVTSTGGAEGKTVFIRCYGVMISLCVFRACRGEMKAIFLYRCHEINPGRISGVKG